jgi:hypothetical protein
MSVLIEMSKAYNKENPDKIELQSNMEILNPHKYKRYLVSEINSRLNDVCTDQQCWSKQSFITNMEKVAREELNKFTFRPESPYGQFTWLNTIDINKTMAQYEKKYKDFRFMGALPIDFSKLDLSDRTYDINNLKYDELLRDGINKLGVIFNLDEHHESGSHWVAMFTDLFNGKIRFFDSYGIRPVVRIRSFMRKQARNIKRIYKSDINIKYNTIQHQKENTECGVYSINYLVRMARGDDFDEICNSPIPDSEINKCRYIYFSQKRQ